MPRTHVLWAVFRRNFVSYFSSPTGYVFITVFILLSSATAFFQEEFFENNLANLDTLNTFFPYLLLFFIPAVGMASWSEERRQGTDELLMTLPAKDLELVLGKYLAALGIYLVALLFSVSHVVVLAILGTPDIGVLLGAYLGYAFLGAGLLPAAMAASALTSSVTVSFILGAVVCAVPVFVGKVTGTIGESIGRLGGVDFYFRDLSSGVLSLQALVYFVSLAAVMLYVNLVLLARRHVQRPDAWGHLALRTVSLLVAGACLAILTGRLGWRADLTAEGIHSLSDETHKVVEAIPAERAVLVQAYVSSEVPPSYAKTKKDLLSLLREYDVAGGSRVQLRVVETERWTDEAREASALGIEPRPIFDEGADLQKEYFLGVAFTSGPEQVVIPFLHKGLSVEYELTRSLGIVSGAKRKRVGIANTDARLQGGMNFQTFTRIPEWGIVTEIKKQYDMVSVSLDVPVTEELDALIVAMPSSLTQPQMDNLLAYVRGGGPTLLFDDPFPGFNPGLAPDRPKEAPRMPGMMAPPPQQEQKGDIRSFTEAIGISWIHDDLVWSTYNPHQDPRLRNAPAEILFTGPAGNPEAFNPDEDVTSGLQEMVFLFAGELQPRRDLKGVTFTPLVRSPVQAGVIGKNRVFRAGPFGGISRVPRPPYGNPTGGKVIAAHVRGRPDAGAGAAKKETRPLGGGAEELNVIFVADADCISEMFFDFRRQGQVGEEDIQFDNVTFVLNCVDTLADDRAFVELRKRRPKHRTLTRLEENYDEFTQRMLKEQKEATDKAEEALDEAKKKLEEEVRKVEQRTDLDQRQRDRLVAAKRDHLERQLKVDEERFEDEKLAAIEASRTRMEQSKRSIQNRVRIWSMVLPALFPLALGIGVLLWRLSREGRTV